MSSLVTPSTPFSDAQLIAAVNQELMHRSPADLAQVVTTGDAQPWIPYDYLEYINRFLLRACDPDDPLDRLLITIPYRHGKSFFCSQYLPAWYLNRFPDRRIILASYADEFAERWGRDVRTLIESYPDLFDVRISKASSAANRWDIEGHRGGMKTAGVGGQLTGWGAHLFVVDDPVKDDEEARSVLQRENKWRWWNTVAHSRLEPGAAVVVIGTRWHEDDFIGRIMMQGDRWHHINLPALAEEDDLIGRKPGQALCPDRYDENALAAIKDSIPPAHWLAGYQQRPTPEGGGRFPRKDFRFWAPHDSEEVPGYILMPHKDDPSPERIIVPQADCGRFATVDTALSTKNYADYTVIGIWDIAGWLNPSRLILHDLIRIRLEGADHLSLLERVHKTYKPTWIGIEDTALSMTLISMALRQGYPVRRLKPEKDKYGRSDQAVTLLMNHRVYFPEKARWYADFEHELLSFPAGTHDDQVDVFSYAAREFAHGYGVKPRNEDPGPQTYTERVMAHRRTQRNSSKFHPSLGVGY